MHRAGVGDGASNTLEELTLVSAGYYDKSIYGDLLSGTCAFSIVTPSFLRRLAVRRSMIVAGASTWCDHGVHVCGVDTVSKSCGLLWMWLVELKTF